MRINSTVSRRAAAVAMAGALAFGVTACSEDDGVDVDTEVSEGDVVDDAASEVDDAATTMESEMTEMESEG